VTPEWSLHAVTVCSGGQTGVDRGALIGAKAQSMAIGGWCPKGRLAEDGRIPDEFCLVEATTDDYALRTQLNVECTDATLILTYEPTNAVTGGTALTARLAKEAEKPRMIVQLDRNVDQELDEKLAREIGKWLSKVRPLLLNIAGPRESKAVGIQKHTAQVVASLFRRPGRCVCGRALPEALVRAGRRLFCTTCAWRTGPADG